MPTKLKFSRARKLLKVSTISIPVKLPTNADQEVERTMITRIPEGWKIQPHTCAAMLAKPFNS
jgi:hypothetical protein